MPRSRLPAKVEWLLHEGESERRVPHSDRVAVEDDYLRMTTERFDVSDGMRVFLTSAKTFRPLTLTPAQGVPGEWMAANVAVKGEVSLAATDGHEAVIDGTRSVLYRTFDRAPHYGLAPGRTLKLAGYMLRTDRISRIFQGTVPAAIQPFVEPSLEASLVVLGPVSTRLKRLASSLFGQGLNGPLRAIFMEGVVLQLFALQAAGYDGRLRERAVAASPKERAAIEAARDRLLRDMRNPPTLAELAAAVGMSEKAINAGFRSLYGATVFEVLRDERLEHARLALEAEALPVKVVAFRVGYNHVTNFTTAFARRYGSPPRRLLRARSSAGRQQPTEASSQERP